jgi:quinol monooxygenase YgiN
VALLEEVQAASRRDDGCLHYGYHTEITDPLSFIAVEEWRDQEALAAHLRQPHVARLIAALPELGERLEIAAHEVAASGPLPLPG